MSCFLVLLCFFDWLELFLDQFDHSSGDPVERWQLLFDSLKKRLVEKIEWSRMELDEAKQIKFFDWQTLFVF